MASPDSLQPSYFNVSGKKIFCLSMMNSKQFSDNISKEALKINKSVMTEDQESTVALFQNSKDGSML